MAEFHCPGQDTRYWKPEDIFDAPCPRCGAMVEFWKDDPRRRCRSCGENVPNPKPDFGCAKWCKHAAECLGAAAPSQEDRSMCDRLIAEMKLVFGEDQAFIKHPLAVLDYAERILEAEGGDPLGVKAAAILHDIGVPEARRKHGASTQEHQEAEGPLIAREILQKLGVAAVCADHVCRIIGNHHSIGQMNTLEFRIVWDADHLTDIGKSGTSGNAGKMRRVIDETFYTQTGKALAAAELRKLGIKA